MAFWIFNKEDDTPTICGSVIAVSEVTEISKDTLYDYFSRKKVLEFENENYRIVKLPIVRALRS
jgi:hypothetical protein